jgi:Mediator complex subunit 13 N-terminal
MTLVISVGTFRSADLASPLRFQRSPQSEKSSPPVSEVYASLITAIKNHVAYRLAKDSPYVPISSTCFALTRRRAELQETFDISSVIFTNIVCRLTSAGSLLVSIYPDKTKDFVNVGDILSNGIVDPDAKVTLAPVSAEATFIGDAIADYDADSSVEWRRMLVEFLHTRGVSLEQLDKPKAWVKVCLSSNSKRQYHGLSLQKSCVIWPASLCFMSQSSAPVSREDVDTTPVNEQSTELSQNLGIENDSAQAIGAAEKWILHQPDREKQIVMRKQQIQEAGNSQKYPVVSSPMSVRNMYGETQGLPGVYPTPPDGLSQGQFNGPLDHAVGLPADTPSIYGANDVDMRDFAVLDRDQTSLNAMRQMSDNRSQGVSPSFDDGLFEDIEGEEFTAQKITDADFDFFDVPGGNDNMDELGNDNGGSDNFQDSTLQNTTIDQLDQPIKAESSPHATPGAIDDIYQVSPIPKPEQSILDVDNTFLSPEEVRKRLFSSGLLGANDPLESLIPKSAFGPLAFNKTIVEADAKYSKAGLFGFSRNLKDKRPASLNISLPPRKRRITNMSESNIQPLTLSADSSDSVSTGDTMSDVQSQEDLDLPSAVHGEMSTPVDDNETKDMAMLSAEVMVS